MRRNTYSPQLADSLTAFVQGTSNPISWDTHSENLAAKYSEFLTFDGIMLIVGLVFSTISKVILTTFWA